MKAIAILFLTIGVLLQPGVAVSAQDAPTIQGRELNGDKTNPETMIMIRRIGLERDRSQVDRLLEIVRQDKVVHHVITACWALGRIGDPRALSVYNNITFWHRGTNVRRLLTLDKARMLYEQAANGEKSATVAEASTRLNIFLDALGLTLPELKKRFERDVERGRGPDIPDRTGHYDIYLGRELADIIFTYGDENLKRVVEEAGIKFARDFLSDWKVQAAFLSPAERLERLIRDIQNPKTRSDMRETFNQLLVDLGEPAQQAVAQKLRDIHQHRDDYPPKVVEGFLDLYSYFRDNRNRGLVQPFKMDSDKRVAETANYVDDLIENNKVLFEFMDTRY